MPANDRQVGGTHYSKHGGLQHWDIVIKFGLDYFQGQITKYVMRWKDKGGLQDLKKAQHFLEKYIEQIEDAEATAHACGDVLSYKTEVPGDDQGQRSAAGLTQGKAPVQPLQGQGIDLTCPACDAVFTVVVIT